MHCINPSVQRLPTTIQFVGTCCLATALLVACSLPSAAAIVTYQFSGIHNGSFAPPASDLIPDYFEGDPFSGTLTYDTSAPGALGTFPGQPLAITLLFDGVHALNWTSAASLDSTYLFSDSFADLISFRKQGTPSQAAEFNDVVPSEVFVDLLYNPGTGPSDLAEVDPNSPDIFARTLRVRLHGPSLWIGDPGAPTTVDFIDTITSFSLVPDPSTLALAVFGCTGFLTIAWRRSHFAQRRGF